MDRPPSKTLDSPRQPRRRGTTPSISETPHPSQPAPVPGSTSTPLPSIRHLHPNLPPPNQYLGHSDPPSYPSPSYDHPPPQPGHVRYQPAHQDPGKELLPIDESDSDKHSSPPPKKRRKRQALSCTECKRRKIKCDRTQPCGPCARRGEQDKCQWHQVETNDKYVTRTEYDQLRARVDHLEAILARITGAGNVHMQATMVAPPTMQTGAGPSNPPYVHGRSTSGSYNMAPEYGSDPYSVTTRPSVTALPSSSRTILSGDINPPVTEREIPTSRQYQPPHRPASRQFRHTLGPVTAAPSYGSTEGTDERPKKRFAWTLQGHPSALPLPPGLHHSHPNPPPSTPGSTSIVPLEVTPENSSYNRPSSSGGPRHNRSYSDSIAPLVVPSKRPRDGRFELPSPATAGHKRPLPDT